MALQFPPRITDPAEPLERAYAVYAGTPSTPVVGVTETLNLSKVIRGQWLTVVFTVDDVIKGPPATKVNVAYFRQGVSTTTLQRLKKT
jgi:hypothetical protein